MVKFNRSIKKIVMMVTLLQVFVATDLAAMLAGTTRKVASGFNRSVAPAMVQGFSGQRAFSGAPDLDAIPNDAQRLRFLQQNFGQKLDTKVNLLKVNRFFTLVPFSYRQLAEIMNLAEDQSVQAGLPKITTKYIYDAEMDYTMGPASPQYVELPDKKGVMILPFEKRLAVHEAGHALVDLYSQSRACVTPLISIQPRGPFGGVTYAADGYRTKNYMTDACVRDFIMMKQAGRVAEQVAGLDGSAQMLTDKKAIFAFLSAPHAGNDIAEMEDLLKGMQAQNNLSDEFVQELIVEGYKNAYQFLTQKETELVKLSDQLLEKGILYEDEISVDAPKTLYDFEQGPLPKEHIDHDEYRKGRYPYGYDDQGNYVGKFGIRDQFGNIKEFD